MGFTQPDVYFFVTILHLICCCVVELEKWASMAEPDVEGDVCRPAIPAPALYFLSSSHPSETF